MTDEKPIGEDQLERYFAEARLAAPLPGAALLDRIIADADAEAVRPPALPQRAPAAAPRRSVWSDIANVFGGWRGLGGLATAGVAGLWIGASGVDTATGTLSALLPSFASDSVELIPASGLSDLFAAAGES